MKSLLAHWQRFWFSPESAENLGLCRAAYFGALFLYYVGHDLSAWGDVSRAFWFPTTLFKRLPLPVLSSAALAIAQVVWKVSLLASALGFLTRAAVGVAAAGAFYLLGLPHNYGKTHHFDAMVVIITAVLAASHAGDAWSLDRFLARRRGAPEPAPSGEYRWPVRAAWVTMALVFFAAGVSKLRHGGAAWILSDNMSILLLQHGYQVANADPPTRWGVWLAQFPALCSVLAAATILVETGYPLALFFPRARLVFPLAMCLTLLGIRLLMGPTFPQFVICHLFWVPWADLLARFGSRPERVHS